MKTLTSLPRRRSALACLGAGSLALLTSLGLSSCDTATGQGAGIGAASGAIIGGIAGGNTRSAALGAAAGAAAGALIGSTIDRSDPAYARYRDYPVGTPSGRRGTTISPYAPYYEIETSGARHGDLVRDTSCGRIFVKP